jgi:hypothetical protein
LLCKLYSLIFETIDTINNHSGAVHVLRINLPKTSLLNHQRRPETLFQTHPPGITMINASLTTPPNITNLLQLTLRYYN